MTEMRATNLAQISGNGDMTRVVLLGVLRNEPMHGYRIKQTLHEWHMDFWADIQGGSIYAGLKRLVSEGLVEKVGSSREGNRRRSNRLGCPPRSPCAIRGASALSLIHI